MSSDDENLGPPSKKRAKMDPVSTKASTSRSESERLTLESSSNREKSSAPLPFSKKLPVDIELRLELNPGLKSEALDKLESEKQKLEKELKELDDPMFPDLEAQKRKEQEIKEKEQELEIEKIKALKQCISKQLTAESPNEQLKAVSPYPTPYVLAQFASLAYENGNALQNAKDKLLDALQKKLKKAEDKLEVLKGWQFLTAAKNTDNSYFGAAYWNPEQQLVVIAHRGTEFEPTIAFLKDLKADLALAFNRYTPQISSACTFADRVTTVLNEVSQEYKEKNQNYKVNFQLFFTGHSLGGWLAQITTFTTEYLKKKKVIFLDIMMPKRVIMPIQWFSIAQVAKRCCQR
jgi:hypothetical protein